MTTPEQYREARRLLGWEPVDLALAAATTVEMVLRLEQGFGVRSKVRADVITAFAANGIAFGRDGGVHLAEPAAALSRASRGSRPGRAKDDR